MLKLKPRICECICVRGACMYVYVRACMHIRINRMCVYIRTVALIYVPYVL